jgi:hypothetical protein
MSGAFPRPTQDFLTGFTGGFSHRRSQKITKEGKNMTSSMRSLRSFAAAAPLFARIYSDLAEMREFRALGRHD